MNTDSLALSNKDISIYVITTGDSERVSRINEFLFSLDFEFVQSDCLEELKILEERYKKISHRFRQKAIMSGEIGAFKTHAQAWERIIQSNKPGIIIEDNIDFIRKPSILMSSKVFDLIESCAVVVKKSVASEVF
ncbi:MAG: glycosyltransferase family 25 protein [Halomonas sp.]